MSRARLTHPALASPPVSHRCVAIDDRNLARAVHFIRQHACDGIKVKDVLKAVPHSRTLLESRFKGSRPDAARGNLRVRLNRVNSCSPKRTCLGTNRRTGGFRTWNI